MYLVQLLLPLYDDAGERVPHARFAELRTELTDRFGGTTAFFRSPAQGTWKEASGEVDRDEVVLCEIMADELDREWWAGYRRKLESRFGQRELVVRVSRVDRL